MTDARVRRRQRRELTERLVAEYAGALPPGQVLAAVARVDHVLVGRIDAWTADADGLRESLVRDLLVRRIGGRTLARPS